MDTTRYGPPAGDEDVEAFAEILATCFPSASGAAGDWVRYVGEESCRLLHRGGRLAGGLATEIHIDVQDELLPGNQGRFVLTVRDGRGVVERGGEGILRVPIHGLAPLYSGHLPAEAARAAGLLDGPAGHAARVAQAFAGSAPWMADMF